MGIPVSNHLYFNLEILVSMSYSRKNTAGYRTMVPRNLILFHNKDCPSWYKHSCYRLQWRHNDYDSVSNHQPHGCLLNRLFRPRSKKISKLRVTGLCVGNSPGPVNSPHKGPVTRKIFPFDDVIMKDKMITRASFFFKWKLLDLKGNVFILK